MIFSKAKCKKSIQIVLQTKTLQYILGIKKMLITFNLRIKLVK